MPTELAKIQTVKDKYRDIVTKEISKLKSGYGLTTEELAKACGIQVRQFRFYQFHKIFRTATHKNVKYYVK